MKKFLGLLLFFVLCFDVYGEDFGPGSHFTNYFSDDYINVATGASVYPESGDVISVNSMGITLNNDGVIGANIDTNHNNLYIRNSGIIDGDIIMYDDCDVTQIIKSGADIQKLNLSGDHTVIVDINNFSGVANLNQLKGLDNASFFQITDSGIIMDDFAEWQNWDAEIHLNGSNILYINNPETVHSGDVVAHVINPSNVHIVLLNSGNLYTVTVQSLGSGITLNVVRETDYDKIFENQDGDFFGILRANHIDDKLLSAMDSASDINELQNIINSSHRFNHSILMRPVTAINNFSLMNIFDYDEGVGIKLVPSYISSGDFGGYGLRADFSASDKDLYLGAGVYFNEFNYDSEYSNFAGRVYGANAKIKQYIDNFWVNGVAGFSLTDFDADYIYSGNGIQNNPYGYALYGGIDGGYDYKVFDDLVLSPFFGCVFQNLKVLKFSDTDVNLRGGGNVKYAFSMDGIRYEYSATVAVATNADVFATFKIGFVSISDGAGISLGLDVFKNEYDNGYRASISGKVNF